MQWVRREDDKDCRRKTEDLQRVVAAAAVTIREGSGWMGGVDGGWSAMQWRQHDGPFLLQMMSVAGTNSMTSAQTMWIGRMI